MFHAIAGHARPQRLVIALTFFFAFTATASSQTIAGNFYAAGITKVAVNPATNHAYVVTTIYDSSGQDTRQRRILVVDVPTLAVIAAMNTGEIARIVVNPATNRFYALEGGTYEESNRVMVFDGDTNQILTVINVPEHTRDLAVNPISNRIYGVQGFTDSSTSQPQLRAFAIDGSSNSVVGATAFYPGNWGQKIVVNSATNRFYVMNTNGPDVLFVFNGDTNSLEKTVSYAGLNLRGAVEIEVNPVANKIYVLSFPGQGPFPNSAILAVVDGNTNELHSTLQIGNSAQVKDVAVNPTTNRLYVTDGPYYTDTWPYFVLSEFDGNTNSIISKTVLSNDSVADYPLRITVNSQTNRLFIDRVNVLSIFDPVDVTPPLLMTSNMTEEATAPSGAPVHYAASATDNSNVAPAIQCSIPSGSTFSIGTTPVTCWAIDTTGNQSAPQTFGVSVVDTTGPNLALPETIFTDATSASGAIVNYVASASDAVDGDRPTACSPVSGSTFTVGETVVTCTATDTKDQTSTGTFQVFVLGSNDEPTAPGWDVFVSSSDSGLTLTYAYVDQPGVTTVAPIDPSTIGETPSGFAVSGVAYEIHTTSVGAADNGVSLAFIVPDAAGMSLTEFESLRVLHNNNGILEDVTSGYDYASRTIYAYTYSFSPFYLARAVQTKITTLFDRSTPYKAGSTVPVRLTVRDVATNANLSSPSLKVTARSLKRLGNGAVAFTVNDSGSANPDNNFRYLGNTNEGAYIFNLSTKELLPGTYALSFYVGSDRSFFYTVKFGLK